MIHLVERIIPKDGGQDEIFAVLDRGKARIAKLLIDRGIDIHAETEDGLNAKVFAMKGENVQLQQLLESLEQ